MRRAYAVCSSRWFETPWRPPLREVVITSIDTGTALEIEVADSGPPRTVSSIDHGAAERLGGGLVVVPCAEGGTAVTLSLPRRVAMARAA
jgi:hypothetical protein